LRHGEQRTQVRRIAARIIPLAAFPKQNHSCPQGGASGIKSAKAARIEPSRPKGYVRRSRQER
jgi:hypothetical protein